MPGWQLGAILRHTVSLYTSVYSSLSYTRHKHIFSNSASCVWRLCIRKIIHISNALLKFSSCDKYLIILEYIFLNIIYNNYLFVISLFEVSVGGSVYNGGTR